jgi:hypothetical protein
MRLRKLLRKRNRRRQLLARAKRRGWKGAVARHTKAIRKLNDLIRVHRRQRVIPREDWGAAPPRGSYTPQYSVKAGVQHHTAMPTMSPHSTRAQEAERMRQLQAGHLAQGWTDIGYALVIFPSGRIYEGRPKAYVGAHTLGYNTGYAGWSLDGNYEIDSPTPAAIASCHYARQILGVADKPLYGHYELGPTACPGKNLKPYLGKGI